jgi:DNA polymerase-1
MVQFGDLNTGWAIPWERWGGVAAEALRKYEGRLCGHNVIPYDSRVFKAQADGWELPVHRTDDAMLQAAIEDSAQRKGLKPLSDRLVDPDASAGQAILHEAMDKNKWTWDTVPVDFPPFWIYSALDPVLSAHMDAYFTPRIAASGQEAYDLERATGRICATMMLAGMQVDTEYMETESAKIQEFSAKSLGWLKDQHGVESVNSAAQLQRAMTALGTPLVELTGTGLPKTDKDTLGAFRHHPDPKVATFIQQVLAVRHAQRITDFYFDSFRRHLEPGDVIRASINILAARTSRMSVSDPPLQQLPRDDKMVRGAFVPHAGHVFITCDLAQIEARLSAHFSQDAALIEVFRLADETGADFFCALAGQIFQQEIARADRRRSLTKNVTYGKLYAAGLDKMAATAGVPVEQMRPVRAGFDNTYHQLLRFSNQMVDDAKAMDRPYVDTPTGRKIMLPKGREATTAFNSLLQGHAAEYMKMCLVRIDSAGLGSALRMVVHDEAILEVPREDAADALRTVEECMTDRTSYRVPITAEGSVMVERWQK